MALTKDEVVEEVRRCLIQLKKKHDIKEGYLFGSFARGNPREYSDVDIAVVLGSVRDGSPFDERFEIFHEMQEYNSLFEVVCFEEDEFRKEETMLAKYIRHEGIRIL